MQQDFTRGCPGCGGLCAVEGCAICEGRMLCAGCATKLPDLRIQPFPALR